MLTRTRQGIVEVIGGSMALAADTAEELKGVLEEILQNGVPRIVINLDGVPLIDSAGLDVLMNAHDRCESRGGMMLLAVPNALCRDILRMTRVDESLGIFNDLTQAIQSYSR